MMRSIFLIIMCALAVAGCSKTVYVPAENVTVKTDSAFKAVYTDRLVIERDTVNTYTKGDTVFRESVKWRVRNVESHDTVYKSETDSVRIREPYPVEVPVYVEKKLSRWQTAMMWIGTTAVIALLVLAANKIRKRFRL